jgi:asparagine synthase (glutamine-hydrolysing)
MCGIAGIYHYADPNRPVDRDLLGRMTRVLAHRGPDAEDFHVKGNLGFGHRRLSIVDLSPTGAQPMPNDDGSCWITYNGEFYNHAEFRPRLEARGARFRGPSDTETLLRLMEHEGPDALANTSGIFGFGFWDSRKQTLTLARDPLGVKQVYFYDNGRSIIFASEIKALLQDPEVPREPDPEAINQYLHFHTALFDRTFFRGIKQLRAGEYMQVSRYGARVVTYWSVTDFTKMSGTDTSLVDDLRHQLSHVVGQQLMSDVPVGSFFSGGIDSSAVAAFASQTGRKPVCFGVHFTGQGVTDERPYQEAAAEALGLDLRLVTMDGSDFPREFSRLMYHQDEPVIGAAMFPMSIVSQLASESVKVCLGGQAADEIFGGYARYALGQPAHVLKSWFANRQSSSPAGAPQTDANVGSNLARQVAEGGTLVRLARNAHHLLNWETSYFEHFAKVPERSWLEIFSGPEFCSRERSRQLFHDTVTRSPATKPMDKIMHWDLQTYLTGLFHQDDRMSMASSLESRVPFADPRLVRFAFKVDPDLRFRGGASKWILRRAVANVLPSLVLSRRKVGFDTPAAAWLAQHDDFVRGTLLSKASLERGLWKKQGIESLLQSRTFDLLWKTMSIELWASLFLDSAPAQQSLIPSVSTAAATTESQSHSAAPLPLSLKIRYLTRECIELGVKGTIARAAWELKTRGGFTRLHTPVVGEDLTAPDFLASGAWKLPFADPREVAPVLGRLVPSSSAENLLWLASEATRGRILCFGRWMADFGNPIDWHRDPTSGHRWQGDSHWTNALRNMDGRTDVKFAWEAGRFPHAYYMARAAVLDPAAAPQLAEAFSSQVLSFIDRNAFGAGLHWFSGQEITLRHLSWFFGLHVFAGLGLLTDVLKSAVSAHLAASAAHIARHIEYARDSVYNNHLLSEALGLFVAGSLLHGEEAEAWRATGIDLLTAEADRQIYPDGGYINQSHNYHRGAMELYLWATAFVRANGQEPPVSWLGCMERSLVFLLAHQNEADGRLPNYGSNDGSDPVVLTTCDFADFRPVLQALSVVARAERIYPPGPWDEMAVWLFGAHVLDLPLRIPARRSVSFSYTGYHVLRAEGTDSFGAFRCGSILDRFSQIDMLNLDVYWRGENVLVDSGSYLYNSSPKWHNHFLRTESHNTIQIDGRDQMPHIRQFKTLYRTQARLWSFEDNPDWAACSGEHYGYDRSEHCIHRRSVLFLKRQELWVVLDTVKGQGTHLARLQWLAGEYPHHFDAAAARLTLATPHGEFSITVLDRNGVPNRAADVVTGADYPPRGWLSRYYGEKVPVPSMVSATSASVPISFVTLASPGDRVVEVSGDEWTVTVNDEVVHFRIKEDTFKDVSFAGKTVSGLRH